MIFTSLPSLCSVEEYQSIVKSAFESGILTHNGPIVKKLEKQICIELKIDNYLAVTSGTIALQLAIEALKIKGTIIIPAFSWIASAGAAQWQGCNIKFCDINPETLNICPISLEKSIDSTVEAIMPVHVFGNPCEVEVLDEIAKKYNLKIIYDSAHAFGSEVNGNSVLNFGDISCVSTHATKIFNTGEGGGLVSHSRDLNEKIKSLRFFGFDENKNVVSNGINGKMTELHAALGLGNIKYFLKTLKHRKHLNYEYRNNLNNAKNITFQKIKEGSNCSYFAIIFDDKNLCTKALEKLESNNVFSRRYFYPALNKIEILNSKQNCPIAESISERILCLPSHNNISKNDAKFICEIILAL